MGMDGARGRSECAVCTAEVRPSAARHIMCTQSHAALLGRLVTPPRPPLTAAVVVHLSNPVQPAPPGPLIR